jgi:perosamine synthetase
MIPVNRPIITRDDSKSIFKAVKSGWISSAGPEIKNFEKKLSNFIGKNYASTVSSGTAALEISLRCLNLKREDEVIIPNFTIISNLLAVIKSGAKPIAVDCDLKTWNMDIDKIKKAITKKTKAIIATHIYGYPIEIDLIKKICEKKKIVLIEDAAEMIGHEYKKKKCGFFGDLSIFSFYANKHITTGEGGMVLTNDKKLYKKIESFKNLCFGKINRYNHEDIGWNYRFTNLQAALGVSQLKRINSIIKKKKVIGKLYYKHLKDNKNIYIQSPKFKEMENIYWVVGVVILKKNFTADYVKEKLFKFGIDTRSFFWPMNKQKIVKKYNIKLSGNFKNSEHISKYGFYLPSGLGTTKKEIKFICSKLNSIFKK